MIALWLVPLPSERDSVQTFPQDLEARSPALLDTGDCLRPGCLASSLGDSGISDGCKHHWCSLTFRSEPTSAMGFQWAVESFKALHVYPLLPLLPSQVGSQNLERGSCAS